MNKYQEALERLKEMAIRNVYGSYIGEYQEEFEEETQLFQELVERATPKKPNIVREPFAYASYNCAKCDEPVLRSWAGERPRMMPKFCQYCGQEIDWTNESEEIAKGEAHGLI